MQKFRGEISMGTLTVERLIGYGVQVKGSVYYVDSASGLDTNSGKSWGKALLTIAAAYAFAIAGDVIVIKGSFTEAVTIAVAKTGLSIIGAGTGPNQATWTAAADATALTINATDVLVAGIRFRPPAYTAGTPAAIKLGGASYARIIDCRFQGKTGSYFAIYSPVCDSDNVLIRGCQFIYLNNITTVNGTAIGGVEAGGLSYSSWVIEDCDFNAPVIGVDINGRGVLIRRCHFRINGLKADATMGAVCTKAIDLTGTSSSSNHVHGNFLGGAYSETLYKDAADDDWSGNLNIAGLTAANPAP